MKKNMSLSMGLLLGAGILSSCTMTGPANLRVHQVDMQGTINETVAWVYGTPNAGSSTIKIAGTAAEVRSQVTHPLALEGTLSVNGQAVYRSPLSPAAPKLSVSRSASTFSVQPLNGTSVAAVYYLSAGQWYKLSGTSGNLSAAPTTGLRGAGQLTTAEADALSGVLSSTTVGTLAVVVLNDPTAPLSVEPQPTERLKTSLYVVPVTEATTATVTTTVNTPAQTTAPSTAGGNVSFTEVASGTSASVNEPTAMVATTDAEARGIYAVAYGRQSSRPSAPTLGNDTLIGVFAGQFSTGGYHVKVDSVQASGTSLTVRTRISGPSAGMLTTQALTNPWVMIKVAGKYKNVAVLDEKGNPLR